MLSEWSKFTQFVFGNMSIVPEDVVGDGNCFYRVCVRSGILPFAGHVELREQVALFALGLGRIAAEQAFNLVAKLDVGSPVLLIDRIANLNLNGTFASNLDT